MRSVAENHIPEEIKFFSGPVFSIKIRKGKQTTGLYFLYSNNDLVYIGKTKFLYSRIDFHLKDKVFDACYFIRMDESLLMDEESRLILKHKPKYNLSHNLKNYHLTRELQEK